MNKRATYSPVLLICPADALTAGGGGTRSGVGRLPRDIVNIYIIPLSKFLALQNDLA